LGGFMKESRFGESQVPGILKEGEAGVPVAEILLKHVIGRKTYFAWKCRYAGSHDPIRETGEVATIPTVSKACRPSLCPPII
jgi:hypothetical protein